MSTTSTAKPSTVEAYLAALPEDRRAIVQAIREVINANLPEGYAEGMQYGMIGYFVPHRIYPAGYHANPKEPLPLAALASQKQYVSLYLMGLYVGAEDSEDSQWFRQAWQDAGHKLNMGKSCVRIKNIRDVPLDVVAQAIRRLPVQEYIRRYEAATGRRGAGTPAGRG